MHPSMSGKRFCIGRRKKLAVLRKLEGYSWARDKLLSGRGSVKDLQFIVERGRDNGTFGDFDEGIEQAIEEGEEVKDVRL